MVSCTPGALVGRRSFPLDRHEPVSDVAHGADQGFVLGAELGPQPPDVDVHRARAAEVVVAPDLLQQLGAGEDPARMLGEELEQLEFLEGEVEHAAAQPGRVGRLVDGQFARADLVGRLGDRGDGAAADGQPDPGLHLGGTGCVHNHVVDAPLGVDRREPALGHDREERAVQAGRLQQAADALGVHELTAGVHQHGIGGRGLHQGGRIRGQHADRVQQEP